MKAMILKRAAKIERAPLSLEEIETPKPKKGELLVKVKACGVCHTDLHIVEGDIPLKKSPIIPGHEVIGVVSEIGTDVTKFKKGDRVGIPWLYSTCGKCEFCLDGKENLCESAKFTGWDVDGGYAEYIIGLEDFTYKIPEKFSDIEAAPLMCAGVVGYRAYRLSEIKPGQRLGLFGFGTSAHVIIQIANYHRCEVYVFTRSASHKKHAEELDAKWVGDPKDNPPKKLDSAIIFAPKGSVVLDALRVIKNGGVVANSSIYMDDIPKMNYEKYLYHEKKLLSVANSTRKDVIDFLTEAEKASVKNNVSIFPFKDANKVLGMLKRSEINGAAVLTFD